ncbi:hypothetical protein STIAU_4801 [Stigmatella aurantiaca DW4/3-1]|uniref:Uncharacterized protein n=1 Tax=Stigmatella aurantiaca (strain DW4/3-1) TaxID=378806 RepID=Q08ZY5_STIAD|nr:hypothetical protein STIAU_4801 [Stigmatella aurantiaca DW4/3-1]
MAGLSLHDLLTSRAHQLRGVARVDDAVGLLHHCRVVDVGVIGEDDHRVVLRVRLRGQRHGLHLVVEAVALFQLRHVRVVVADLGALLDEQRDDAKARALAHVVDVLLVGRAQAEHLRAIERLLVLVERLHGALHHVVGHLRVHLARKLDELGVELVLARLPRQVERIDRDAVPTEAGARVEGHEAERLGAGRLDDLPHIDVHPVAEHLHLVDHGDVHAPEDVLQQLGELRHARGGHRNDFLERAGVEGLGHLEARGREATDDLRNGLRVEALVARVLTLGAEGQVEVHARLQAALLQQRLEHLLGGARVRGGLQHEQLVGPHVGGQRLPRLNDEAHVRLARGRQWRGHADDDAVHVLRLGEVRGRLKLALAGELLEWLAGDVLDVALPLADLLDLALVDVETRHRKTGLRERHPQRQTHVAQPHHAHLRLPLVNHVHQRALHQSHRRSPSRSTAPSAVPHPNSLTKRRPPTAATTGASAAPRKSPPVPVRPVHTQASTRTDPIGAPAPVRKEPMPARRPRGPAPHRAARRCVVPPERARPSPALRETVSAAAHEHPANAAGPSLHADPCRSADPSPTAPAHACRARRSARFPPVRATSGNHRAEHRAGPTPDRIGRSPPARAPPREARRAVRGRWPPVPRHPPSTCCGRPCFGRHCAARDPACTCPCLDPR